MRHLHVPTCAPRGTCVRWAQHSRWAASVADTRQVRPRSCLQLLSMSLLLCLLPSHCCTAACLSPSCVVLVCVLSTYDRTRRAPLRFVLCCASAGVRCVCASLLIWCVRRRAAPGSGSCSDCTDGYYCPTNATDMLPCPAGRFGSTALLTNSSCTGTCLAGYYCPEGSKTNSPLSCGSGNAMYCPAGTPIRLTVPPGSYATGGSPDLRTSIAPCEPGFYCTAGNRLTCPAGRCVSTQLLACLSCVGAASVWTAVCAVKKRL